MISRSSMSITRKIPPPPNASPSSPPAAMAAASWRPDRTSISFVRPFKQTAWGESVIEFILYMLWDLGLKVGHSTRSLAECMRLAKQDITIRTAVLEARYMWGDHALYDQLRVSFWKEVATGNGQDFVEAKLAEREPAPCPPGRKPLSGRAQHQGKQRRAARPADALLDRQISLPCRRCVRPHRAQCLHRRRISHLPEGRSLSVECARPSALSAGPGGRTPVLRRADRLAAALGYPIPKTAPGGGSFHARLLPGGQGCGRSHPHFHRGAGRTAQKAQDLAHPHAAGLPQAPRTQRRFLCREWAADRRRKASSAIRSTSCASSRWPTKRMSTSIPMPCAP